MPPSIPLKSPMKPPPPPKPGALKKPATTAKVAASKAAPQSETPEQVVVTGGSDPFMKSESVYGLNTSNFKSFVNSKDVTMVLFYDPGASTSHWCRPRFIKAAEDTTIPGRVYAAVDCTKDIHICEKEAIRTLPFYKLYSKGHLVTNISEYSDFNSDSMKKYVENSPILEEMLSPVKNCDK